MAFKMKGHALPGIKQRAFEDDSIINSAPRKYETKNGVEGFKDVTREDGRAASSAFQYSSPVKQTNSDLKEFLLSEIFTTQKDVDKAIKDGSWTTESKEFIEWYKSKDVPAEPGSAVGKIYDKKDPEKY